VLRNVLVGVVACATMTLFPAGPAPAATAPGPGAGLEVHPEWGRITGHSGVLRRGCHHYTFDYAITPPEGIWAIEAFISGPGLEHLAAGAFLDGYDPETGSGRYTLCRATTRYGRFTIVAKLSTDDGAGHLTEGLLPTDTFRLRRPRR
jgi:hypothetical protein